MLVFEVGRNQIFYPYDTLPIGTFGISFGGRGKKERERGREREEESEE